MFTNLCEIGVFADHNFNASSGFLKRERDPSSSVAIAFKIPRPHLPDSSLISTLSFTLSPRCCLSFLAGSPGLPVTDRDYFLSKLYQFLLFPCLEELPVPDHLKNA